MKQSLGLVLAGLAGFAGGAVAPYTLGNRLGADSGTVRAHSFELLDDAGRIISYWGVDRSGNAVLTFGSYWPNGPEQKAPVSARSDNHLTDPEYQRATIGVIDDAPFIHMRAGDNKTRLRMYLNGYGKPILLMEDGSGPRVALGIEQSDTPSTADNDWMLLFSQGVDHDLAKIGMYRDVQHGDQIRGFVFVDKGK